MKKEFTIILLAMTLLFSACDPSQRETNTQPAQGELAKTFTPPVETSTPAPAPVVPVKTEAEKLQEEGWQVMNMGNGVMPDCYNYRPGYGELKNELIINTGSGTDVAIKVMSLTTNTCVRYVFVNSNNTYSIQNLPEDLYYLKIAYGKSWISKNQGGRCLGRFMHDALYKKGDEQLDFNRKLTAEGYSVPSFELSLDVVAGVQQDQFQSIGISEEVFND
jgi:hypothetical protein